MTDSTAFLFCVCQRKIVAPRRDFMMKLKSPMQPVPRRAIRQVLWVLFFIGSLLLSGCFFIREHTPTNGESVRPSESRRLHEIFDSFFDAELALFPMFATEIGDHRYDDQLEIAISEEHISAHRRLLQRGLKRLAEIKGGEISAQERLYLDVLARNLRLTLDGLTFKQQLLPVRQLASLAVEFPLLGAGAGVHPFRTVTDYENFLKRMEAFDFWIDTAIGNMIRGIDTGMVQPKVVIERALPQIESLITTDPEASLFYQPILGMPGEFAAADRARLTSAYTRAIEQQINPAYRRLLAFLKNEYLGQCRDTVGLSALPNGSAWYDHLIRTQTTTNLSAEEIFQLGMSEIIRIKKAMEQLRDRLAFSGSLNEFAAYLTSNAPPAYQTRSDLIGGYQTIRAIVSSRLEQLFGRIPTAQFEIRTIEPFRERAAPSQYWSAAPDGSRPGIFYINAAGIEASPRRVSEPLYLHEAVPGHHFQISLQQERDDLPRFQRFADYTAFIEGWALYAESLGSDLGLYQQPAQQFSRLNSELFRAARLVVDVGLHRKQWSREQAIKFLMNTTLTTSESGAALEVDRYIAVPAQALGYKIGQLKIAAIRTNAEKILGTGFDIRKFHDELLRDGALPLDLLERKMDAWIHDNAR
jgi:uncharacterized protein (DUF885 family)